MEERKEGSRKDVVRKNAKISFGSLHFRLSFTFVPLF